MKDIIHNPATGDSMEFLQTAEGTNGRMTEFIITLAPHNAWAKWPRHFHPFQTETFKVLEGELNLTAGDRHLVLKPGDKKVIVEKFMLHSFWNEQDVPVKFQAEIYPPVNIEKGLRLSYKLAQDGKINSRNIPSNPFHSFILMDYFDAYFPWFPWKIQKWLFRMGSNLAGLLGYKKNL